jgi:hypothetical protein
MILVLAATLSAQPAAPKSDERVQVELKNGSAIIGVAPAGRFQERMGRYGYEEVADKSHRRTGIRVWYYRETDGFIFLPYRSVSKVTRLGELTSDESRALRKAIATAEASRSNRPAKVVPTDPGVKDPAGFGAGAQGGLTTMDRKLLREFPPAEGWGAERFGEIQRKKIVLDIQPRGAEKRFVKVYSQWEKALRRLTESKRAGKPGGAGKRLDPSKRPPQRQKPKPGEGKRKLGGLRG